MYSQDIVLYIKVRILRAGLEFENEFTLREACVQYIPAYQNVKCGTAYGTKIGQNAYFMAHESFLSSSYRTFIFLIPFVLYV